MSAVLSVTKCDQCGFLEADYGYYCGSGEWWVLCRRCGYSEEYKYNHQSHFSNGRPEESVHKRVFSAGAYWAEAPDGRAESGGLSEKSYVEAAVKMRADIASGKLSDRSYVTHYNFDTDEVTALVGRVPTQAPICGNDDGGDANPPTDLEK